jgi:hypothetical protein
MLILLRIYDYILIRKHFKKVLQVTKIFLPSMIKNFKTAFYIKEQKIKYRDVVK